jgi:Ca2+-binding RTX toxin-like protein
LILDTLICGPAADILAGGLGQDKLICGQGKDTMLDFNATEEDSRTIDYESATTATIATDK